MSKKNKYVSVKFKDVDDLLSEFLSRPSHPDVGYFVKYRNGNIKGFFTSRKAVAKAIKKYTRKKDRKFNNFSISFIDKNKYLYYFCIDEYVEGEFNDTIWVHPIEINKVY